VQAIEYHKFIETHRPITFAYLSGFHIGQGTIAEKSASLFYTKNPLFLYQIQSFLNEFSITSSVHEKPGFLQITDIPSLWSYKNRLESFLSTKNSIGLPDLSLNTICGILDASGEISAEWPVCFKTNPLNSDIAKSVYNFLNIGNLIITGQKRYFSAYLTKSNKHKFYSVIDKLIDYCIEPETRRALIHIRLTPKEIENILDSDPKIEVLTPYETASLRNLLKSKETTTLSSYYDARQLSLRRTTTRSSASSSNLHNQKIARAALRGDIHKLTTLGLSQDEAQRYIDKARQLTAK
jgi:hypothetical protein